MTAATGVSPVGTRLRLVGVPETGPGRVRATARLRVDAAAAVFDGHFPEFPIFPGVCLVECVFHGIRLAAPEAAGDGYLAGVESARFLRPVFPGDLVDIDLDLSWTSGVVRCRAVVRTDRGTAAEVRLHCPRKPGSPGSPGEVAG